MSHLISVILADDHEVVRRGIRDFLNEESDIHVIAEAANANDAFSEIQTHNPDVVVLDIKMPGESGISLAQRLRQSHFIGGILILSAYDDDPYVWAAVEAGVNGYVMKSASLDTIAESVRDVYEGKQVFATVQSQIRLINPNPETTRINTTLTQREIEIVKLTASGLTNKAIALKLSISDRTVQTHLTNIYRKLDVAGRIELAILALSINFISTDNP